MLILAGIKDNFRIQYPNLEDVFTFSFSFPNLYAVLQLKFRNHLWHSVVKQVAIAVVVPFKIIHVACVAGAWK